MKTACVSHPSYRYRINTIDYPENDSNYILRIQNTQTCEVNRIPILQLAANMDLLAQFSPRDIYMVAYTAAQIHMYQEKEYLQQISDRKNIM